MHLDNIFANIPDHLPDEIFEELTRSDSCKIERIVSQGHTTQADDWYDQARNEWVILLKGKARLLFENGFEAIDMRPGDYINIPAHCRHRVVFTDPREKTVWLAIHY